MRRLRHFLAYLSPPTILAGCDPFGDDYPCLQPSAHVGNRDAQPPGYVWTIDDEYASWGRRIPGGFGGFWLGYPGAPGAEDKYNLYLVRVNQREAAVEELISLLQGWGQDWPRPLVPANFHVLQGDYDYVQLKSCYDLVAEMDRTDIQSTDIDESANRIALGVFDVSVEPRVRAELERMRIPGDMVLVREEAPVVVPTARERFP
jgi:hypothetical protein